MARAPFLEEPDPRDDLNRVYLGAGTYGVDAAAHRYFDKSARQTTLYESAAIAGLLKAPTRFNPIRDSDKAAARTAQVLDKMVDAGVVTSSQAMAALSGGTSLAAVPVRARAPAISGIGWPSNWEISPIPAIVT